MPTTTPRRTEYMRLDDIVAADVNPKAHDEQLIGESIERFGFIETPVLDERTGKLVAGHGRTDDLRRRRAEGLDPPEGVILRKGEWFVPVQRGWSSVDDGHAHAAGVALNRIGERGGWKFEELSPLLDELALSDDGLLGLGYELPDLEDLRAMLAAPLEPDELRDRYGEPKPDALWPVIRMQVPPDLYARYTRLLEVMGDGTEIERFGRMLDIVDAAQS